MAQRKSPPSGNNRPGGKPGKPTGKPGAKTTGRTATKAGAGTPPSRKKPKSIVNQKQRPWGLIATAAAIVVFAAAIIVVVVATRPDNKDSGTNEAANTSTGGQSVKAGDRYRQAAFPAAMAIKGVTYKVQANHTHEEGTIKYDQTPPTGGDHNQYWADCTGTVYDQPIANENAVHMLEHGAVWIAYNADDVKGAQLAKLKSYVSGVDRMALSPYPNLSTPISVQAWGYQLKLTSASDPRIAQFIKVLKFNQTTTPEPGATCSQPTFKEKPSTFGKPTDPYAAS